MKIFKSILIYIYLIFLAVFWPLRRDAGKILKKIWRGRHNEK